MTASETTRGRLLFAVWLGSTIGLILQANSDVAAGDSGEIGGAAQTLGVAHPTGFGLDMLLLRAAGLLPLGSLAFRQNVAVACIAACAVTALARLTSLICEQIGVDMRAHAWMLGPLLAAAALLGFQTFLSASLGVEVYASGLLLVLCAALLAGAPLARNRRAIWPLWGFSASAHVIAPLLILPLCAASWLRDRPAAVRGMGWRVLAIAIGALSIGYLPLASRRDPPFDWGDPETLRAMLRHVSAARVREAYAGDMFGASHATPGLLLFEQLSVHAWLVLPAAIGLWLCLQWRRGWALTLLCVLCLDLGYATWINPMGIAERQVGHASGALLALLAGVGTTWLHARARLHARWLSGVAGLVGLGLCLQLLASAAWPSESDGYVIAERYGALSPWLDLPPRAVYLCSSDTACASALFAAYAEGTRPDLAVAPAQHLWDYGVTRRLRELLPVNAVVRGQVLPPAARRRFAEQVFAVLVSSPQPRPIYLESAAQVDLERARLGFGLAHPPLFAADGGSLDDDAVLARLSALEQARFGRTGPRSKLARESWASAYSEIGRAWLRSGVSASAWLALQWAVALTPERASAHINLGVAFEQHGDLASALRETRRALELEIDRPTPWLNLARLMLRSSGPDAALRVLDEAARRGVQDARLHQLQRQLAVAQGTTGK